MMDINSTLRRLRRPPLLVSAARFGIDAYSRERDLPRTLHVATAPRPAQALVALIALEDEMNAKRLAQAASYSIAHHIDALTAIMTEAKVWRATMGRGLAEADAPAQATAPATGAGST